jgi:hypothetical protein
MLSGARGLKRRPFAPHPRSPLKNPRPLTDVNNSGIMQMPASLRSDLYSHPRNPLFTSSEYAQVP